MRFSGLIQPAFLLGLTLAHAACRGDEATPERPSTEAAEEVQATTGGVERVSPAPADEQPAPAPPETVIQTQEGSPGTVHVDLTRMQVTGDLMTVQLRFRNTEDRPTTVRFPVDEVNYIDDASARRYGVLEDEAGSPMASPMERDDVVLRLGPSESLVAWFRFAAPGPQSQTVSLSIPEVGPFDGIPVSR
jgi:hypothetical protein